jgi:MFS family permease
VRTTHRAKATNGDGPPTPAGARGGSAFVITLICSAQFVLQLDFSVVNPAVVLPGLVLTALGIGLALPTASIAITSGVAASEQGLAGALFTTSQQTGAAVGLAILATAAAAASAGHGGSLVAGYRLSFLIAAGLAVLAAIIVALQLSSKSARAEPVSAQ